MGVFEGFLHLLDCYAMLGGDLVDHLLCPHEFRTDRLGHALGSDRTITSCQRQVKFAYHTPVSLWDFLQGLGGKPSRRADGITTYSSVNANSWSSTRQQVHSFDGPSISPTCLDSHTMDWGLIVLSLCKQVAVLGARVY